MRLKYEFNNYNDFYNLAFKIYNIPVFKDSTKYKIKEEAYVSIFRNLNLEIYINGFLLNKIHTDGEYFNIYVVMKNDNIQNDNIIKHKSDFENKIIRICDYFIENIGIDEQTSNKLSCNGVNLKIILEFDIIIDINHILSTSLGYLKINEDILVNSILYYKKNCYVKQHNIADSKYSNDLYVYALKYNKILMPKCYVFPNLPYLVNKIISHYYYI